MPKQIVLGEVVDVGVEVANVSGYQCPACDRFFTVQDHEGVCICGAGYQRIRATHFTVTATPRRTVETVSENPTRWESIAEPVVGGTYNLAVQFGNQVRYKCLCCKRYLAFGIRMTTCRCGARYRYDREDLFVLERLPGAP